MFRFDSFSKSVAPGLRLGWLTGPSAAIIPLYDVNLVSTLTQVLLHKVLMEWGSHGFESHLDRLRRYYRERCAVTRQAIMDAFSYAPTDPALTPPSAGMFWWFDTRIPNHMFDNLLLAMAEEKVIVAPSSIFTLHTDTSTRDHTLFVRISYGRGDCHDLQEGIRRLARAVRRLVTSVF